MLFIPFLKEKAEPLSYNFNDKWYPFLIPSLHLCIPFNSVNALSFEHKIKEKKIENQNAFSTFSQP